MVPWIHCPLLGVRRCLRFGFPGANTPIDAIPGGRGTYNLYSSELLQIVQNYGAVCFPRAKRDGFLGNMLDKYRKCESNWSRVHFAPHPTLAIEMANFVADTVLYSSVMCMIESLTMGPGEGRLSLH